MINTENSSALHIDAYTSMHVHRRLEPGTFNALTVALDLLAVSSLNRGMLLNHGNLLDLKVEQEQETVSVDRQLNKVVFRRDGILEPNLHIPNERSNKTGGITDISGKAIPALSNDNANPQIDRECLLDYDHEKAGRYSTRSFDLSHLSEPQRYLRVTPSDKKGDDSILLETTSGKEYCVRLKELEMNEEGEFVMTLKPVKDNIFLDYSKKGVSFSGKSRTIITEDRGKILSLELAEELESLSDLLQGLEAGAGDGTARFYGT